MFYIWGHSEALSSVEKIVMHVCGRLSLSCVALSPLNTISCVTVDWIPYLHLCINLNGGHIAYIV
jgi:hypothetical protein